MKCPTCGAENDAANRFCDQCGSRIEPSGGFPQAVVAAQPTAAGPTCPSCGATVLPGEAFCDECGAALAGNAPAAAGGSYDAPTMFAPSMPASDGAPPDQGVICPACGHQNLAGDRFCDNCGAALTGQPAPASPPAAEAQTMMANQDLLKSLNEAPATDATVVPPPAISEAPAATPPAAETPLAEAPTAEQPMVNAAAPQAQAAYEAERKRLEDEIERQQQIIAQFEQMQAMFGAATPPAVSQGLAEARDAKSRAEAELAALQPPPPPVDPAEVARLTGEIERQQQIIAQFEQMQAMFGAATPPAVSQGLAEARDAKSRVEAELASLTGGSPAAQAAPPVAAPTEPSPPAADAPAAPAVPAEPAAPPQPAVPPTAIDATARQPDPLPLAADPSAPTILAPPAMAGIPTGAAPVPRLVIDEGGKELPLPADKREFVVGREDPISGIFPEIDLTPFGGETGGVSRQHARISHTDGQWTITDLNSTNYTHVDGAKIEPSVPVPIKDGTRLRFGRVAMTFHE